jgi:hypothetical protein
VFELEVVEFLVVITLGRNTLRIFDRERNGPQATIC